MSTDESKTRITSSLSPEIIDQIVSYSRLSTLQNVRLVDRQWSRIATMRLFEYISMTPSVKGLSLWQTRLDDPRVGPLPKIVHFNTSIVPDFKWSYSAGSSDVFQRVCSWQPYSYWLNGRREQLNTYRSEQQQLSLVKDQERYEKFYNSFAQLRRLPALHEVSLHFEPRWHNQKLGHGLWPPVETAGFQELILSLLFQALSDRSQDEKNSITKSLCIQNLQDVPLSHPESMQGVMQKIEELKLLITEKHEDTDAFTESFLENRRSFFVHLKHNWLYPISTHLKSLDLAFHGQWGSFSGEIKVEELDFPALTFLRLERFAPATDMSFEWVLEISSLKNLILHDCQIVSHIYLLRQEVEDWGLAVDNWQELTLTRFWDADRSFFLYASTWASHFDRIGKRLLNLDTFHFDGSDYTANENRHKSHVYHSARPSVTMADSRYTSFDSSKGASPWRSPDQNGDLWEVPPTQETLTTNVAKKTYDLDFTALSTLNKLIESRRKPRF